MKRGQKQLTLQQLFAFYFFEMNNYHIPVLAEESLELLNINKAGTYVDLTFGGGGHSKLILDKLGRNGKLYGFDQDKDAKNNIVKDKRFTFVESNFRFMRGQLRYLGVNGVDGILADLGVSSHHFDTADRGFSFRFDAPLDMRMNQRAKQSAATIVNNYDVEQLTQIIRDWGELRGAYRVAQAIVTARQENPINTTQQLLEAIKPVTPKRDDYRFFSQLFQALRIEVNGEMEALKMALEQSLKMLNPKGRLVVISYHSLEDRLVKNFFRSGNFDGKVEKDFYGKVLTPWEVITRRIVTPSEEELELNPRSRSAKLRAAEKL